MNRRVVDFMNRTRNMSLEDKNKEAAKYHCTACGKPFNVWDVQAGLEMEFYMGFGSTYDESHIKAMFCIECFDKIIDALKAKAKEDPIVEWRDVDED